MTSKKLLMIAFHFPPLVGSSGVHRSLNFARDLPEHGWAPLMLSAHPRSYSATSDDQLRQLPPGLRVVRSFALDSARHLSIMGKYPGWLARPDRWTSWLLGAIPAGLALIRKERPSAIWSTYPIPSAHLIGLMLSRLSGLPWIADFRDPMAHEGYPQDPKLWQSYLSVEKKVFAQASRMVFTTEGAARLYKERYPAQAAAVQVIPNGYDELAFMRSGASAQRPSSPQPKWTLLHSGIVYPEWRNPSALFAAVRALLDAGELRPDQLSLCFRAPVHDAWLKALAAQHGVDGIVEILPALAYEEALQEMQAADALLALQSDDCADQVPAKVYEYIRARRPILGLTNTATDTGRLLLQAGVGPVCALTDANQIAMALRSMFQAHQQGVPVTPNPALIKASSRQAGTASLARLLDDLSASARSQPASKNTRPPHTL